MIANINMIHDDILPIGCYIFILVVGYILVSVINKRGCEADVVVNDEVNDEVRFIIDNYFSSLVRCNDLTFIAQILVSLLHNKKDKYGQVYNFYRPIKYFRISDDNLIFSFEFASGDEIKIDISDNFIKEMFSKNPQLIEAIYDGAMNWRQKHAKMCTFNMIIGNSDYTSVANAVNVIMSMIYHCDKNRKYLFYRFDQYFRVIAFKINNNSVVCGVEVEFDCGGERKTFDVNYSRLVFDLTELKLLFL